MRPSVVESPYLPTPSIFGPAQNSLKNHGRSDRRLTAGQIASRSDRRHGRSDRHPQFQKTKHGLAGLTATMAGQTATDLTVLEQNRKRMLSQTINAIAN